MATNQYCKEPSYFRIRALEPTLSEPSTQLLLRRRALVETKKLTLGDLEFLVMNLSHSNFISTLTAWELCNEIKRRAARLAVNQFVDAVTRGWSLAVSGRAARSKAGSIGQLDRTG